MAGKYTTIIYNPMSGRRASRAEQAGNMVRLLGRRGITAEALATEGPDDATRLAREAVAGGAEIIVSYGGDGTLNEVLQGVVGSRAHLAVWPGGTANVVAVDLGISPRIESIAEMIVAGKSKRVALGLIRSSEFGVRSSESEPVRLEVEEGTTGIKLRHTNYELRTTNPEPRTMKERYFLMMAGIGLDASIARGVNRKLKRRTGEFAYWVTGVKHLFRWKPEPFTIEIDGTSYESVFAVVGNGKGYGGGMCMTPGARLEEPWFDVYILPRLASNLSYLRALSGCLRGKPEATGAMIVRGRHIEAGSTDQPWLEADGEVLGPLPVTIDVVPGALSLIVP